MSTLRSRIETLHFVAIRNGAGSPMSSFTCRFSVCRVKWVILLVPVAAESVPYYTLSRTIRKGDSVAKRLITGPRRGPTPLEPFPHPFPYCQWAFTMERDRSSVGKLHVVAASIPIFMFVLYDPLMRQVIVEGDRSLQETAVRGNEGPSLD